MNIEFVNSVWKIDDACRVARAGETTVVQFNWANKNFIVDAKNLTIRALVPAEFDELGLDVMWLDIEGLSHCIASDEISNVDVFTS